MTPVFRFAPSPNGPLHLGHALSAILNHDMARAADGRFLLRIEDIDPARCRPEYEAQIYQDLRWLGLTWEEPVRRQSDHAAEYRAALDGLKARELVYPAFLSRAAVKAHVTDYEKNCGRWKYDPDGTPHYPTVERGLDPDEAAARIARGDRHMWRLNVERAVAALGDAQRSLFSPAGRRWPGGPDEGVREAPADRASGHPLIASHALGTSPRRREEGARRRHLRFED